MAEEGANPLAPQVGHFATNCFIGGDTIEEQVKLVGAQQGRGGNNPYSNTYNPGWRNYPNFSWSNNIGNMPRQQGPLGFQQSIPQDRLSSLESKMDKFLETIGRKLSSQEEKFDQIAKNHSSSIHNLEVQVGQLANALATRNFGSLSSNSKSKGESKRNHHKEWKGGQFSPYHQRR